MKTNRPQRISLSAIALLTLCSCAALKEKSVAIASRTDAFRIETSGSAHSATVAPNIMIGGGGNSLSTSHAFSDSEKSVRTISYTQSASFFGALFGLDLTSETLSYIGTPDESGKEVAHIIRAIRSANPKQTHESIQNEEI